MQKNNNLHSFDDIMDAQFGAPGTPEREQFNREAEAYCVGQLIYKARRDENMTQEALARQVGTNKSYISKIENGLVDPSASLFLRIISALGLRFDIVKPIMQF
jgi:DNA-binding XRE family transcriptional regulator